MEAKAVLSVLQSLVRGGASDGDVGLALYSGKTVPLPEPGGETIHVKPERVERIERHSLGSVLHFSGPIDLYTSRSVVVELEPDDVRKRLKDA